MSTEENKALIRRYLDETWNKGNVAVLDEVCAQDCFADSGGTLPQVKEYVGAATFLPMARDADVSLFI